MENESTKSINELEEKRSTNQTHESSNGDTDKRYQDGKGGWTSSFLILGTSLGLNIALGAWYSNLIVFLINEFNVKKIDAAKINNIINGLVNFFPVIASIAADSTFGAFYVVISFSLVSLVALVMLTLSVTLKSLKPPPCVPNSTTCVPPTSFQYIFLYMALTLASLGQGGARFLLGPMGADQLDTPKQQETYFNWFVFNIYMGWIIGYTILIYVEDSVSWALSYGLAVIANVVAVILFLFGSRIYQRTPPKGSPFSSLARVFVAAMVNMRMKKPVDGEECYYHETSTESKVSPEVPSKSLRFLNKAAMIEKSQDQTTKQKSWSLCTVEEVEDLKKLLKIMPIWLSGVLLSTATGVIMSLTVLMALVMDRRIGPHFKIPAGTFFVISTIFSAISTPILDRFVGPAYQKLTGRQLTYLQFIGVGHVCNLLSLITFALIEHSRLRLVHSSGRSSVFNIDMPMDKPNSVAPISALWLVVPLAIRGVGVAFYFPKETTLFYKEFPKKLRSTSSAMLSLQFAAGYYVSSAFFDLVGRYTSWLPNDINHGRVDKVFWTLIVASILNFAYFLLCAMLYRYNNPDSDLNRDETNAS